VKNVVGLKDDGALSVDYYADAPVDTTVLSLAAAPASTLTTVKGSAKEIGIGVLAIVSLLIDGDAGAQVIAAAAGAGIGALGPGPIRVGRSQLARSALKPAGHW